MNLVAAKSPWYRVLQLLDRDLEARAIEPDGFSHRLLLECGGWNRALHLAEHEALPLVTAATWQVALSVSEGHGTALCLAYGGHWREAGRPFGEAGDEKWLAKS